MVSVIIPPGKCNGVPTNISWLWREVCGGCGGGLGKVLRGRKASADWKENLILTHLEIPLICR